jgi:hypothetical protein
MLRPLPDLVVMNDGLLPLTYRYFPLESSKKIAEGLAKNPTSVYAPADFEGWASRICPMSQIDDHTGETERT